MPPTRFWEYVPDDLANERAARKFEQDARARLNPPPTPPWQPPDNGGDQPPVTGPEAARAFEDQANQSQDLWKQAVLGTARNTEPGPSEPSEPSRAPDLGPTWQGIGDVARNTLGYLADNLAPQVKETWQAGTNPDFVPEWVKQQGPQAEAQWQQEPPWQRVISQGSSNRLESMGGGGQLDAVRAEMVRRAQGQAPQMSDEQYNQAVGQVGTQLGMAAAGAMTPKRGGPFEEVGPKGKGPAAGAREVAPPAKAPEVAPTTGPEAESLTEKSRRILGQETAKTPETPQEWYDYARGALATSDLAEGNMATSSPRLTAKQRREWQTIVKKGERDHPEWKDAYEANLAANSGPEAAARFEQDARQMLGQGTEKGTEKGALPSEANAQPIEPAPTTAPDLSAASPEGLTSESGVSSRPAEGASAVEPVPLVEAAPLRPEETAAIVNEPLGATSATESLSPAAAPPSAVGLAEPAAGVSPPPAAEPSVPTKASELAEAARSAQTVDDLWKVGLRQEQLGQSADEDINRAIYQKAYELGLTERPPSPAAEPPPTVDPTLLQRARDLAQTGPITGSRLQRELNVGYPEAERIQTALDAEGVVGQAAASTTPVPSVADVPVPGVREGWYDRRRSVVADTARQVSDDQLAVMRKRAVAEKDAEALAAIDAEMVSRKGAPITESASPAASPPAADSTPAAPAAPRAGAEVPITTEPKPPAAEAAKAVPPAEATPPAKPRRPASTEPEPPAPGELLGKLRDPAELDALITKEGNIRTAAQTIVEATHGVGTKGLIGLADPGLVTVEAYERVPHVVWLLEEQADTIQRQAHSAMETAMGKVKGVKVKDGRYVEGVAPKRPNLSMAVLDVAEHPNRYRMPQELRDAIDLYWKLEDERVYYAKQAGAKVKLRQYDDEGHHVSRTVLEIRGLEKEGRNRFDLARKFETAEEGLLDRIVYGDLLDSTDAMAEFWTRKEKNAHIQRLTKGMGKAPSELIDQQLTEKAVGAAKVYQRAHKFEQLVKQIRDGLSPDQAVAGGSGRARRAPLRAIEDLLPGVNDRIDAALKLKGQERSAAFASLVTEAETLAKTTGQTYRAAKSARARAIDALRSAEWAPASGATFGLKEDVIGVRRVQQPWASGRLFPEKVAKSLNAAFDQDHSWLTRGLELFGGTVRTLGTSVDLGLMFIHGLPSLSLFPSQAWQAAQGMIKYSISPRGYSQYLTDNMDWIRNLRMHGMTLEGPDYFQGLQHGGIFQQAAQGLGWTVGQVAHNPGLGRAVQKSIEEQALRRVELLFEAPLNILKIEVGKAVYAGFEARGQLDTLGTWLGNLTGTRSLKSMGIGPTQRSIEGMWFFFSPRYTRANMALIADGLQGGAKGEQTRAALSRMAAAMVLFPLSIRAMQTAIPGIQRGDAPEKVMADTWNNVKEALDPINKPAKFLSFELAGTDVGFGTIYRSYLTLLAASYKAGRDDPAAFLHPEDRHRNPLTSWWSGRQPPVTSNLWNLVVGRDYSGEPYNAGSLAPQALPMWARNGLNVGSLAEFVGLRGHQFTPAEKRDELRDQIAQQVYGKPWNPPDGAKPEEGLSRHQKDRLVAEHPELAQATQAAQATGERRGQESAMFWAEVDRQRQPWQQKIAEKTALLNQGQISGDEYRKAVSEAERAMAQVPQNLKKEKQWADIPLTEAERKAKYGADYKSSEHPVDRFLEAYYGLAQLATDPRTQELDPARLVKLREQLKALAPKDVVDQAMEHVNEKRDPEYAQAQAVMREYLSIPKYGGMSLERSQQMEQAARQYYAMKKELERKSGGTVGRTQVLSAMRRELPNGAALSSLAYSALAARPNPARQRFARANATLLNKFYSDVVRADQTTEASPTLPPELLTGLGQSVYVGGR